MTLPLTLSYIAELCGVELAAPTCLEVTGVVIDTRAIQAGNLFVAIKGERVDGHNFLAQARQAGAVAALVSELQDDELPQIVVDDVTAAFAVIAKEWRKHTQAKVVAVTGSNGKTSVKEMIAAILSQEAEVVATQGNLNNNLGVPLTLTRLSVTTDYAVIEMGTNYPGEIAYLVDLAGPDVSVITNIGAAHLEGLGSLDGVAHEKSAIYRGLGESGTAIINQDMPYAEAWTEQLPMTSTISFGSESSADLQACDLVMGNDSSHFMVEIDNVLHAIVLPLPGQHNVMNALAAIATATALNIPVKAIVNGLAAMVSVPHRLQLRRGVNQCQLIDDTYNANPSSYQQALKTLAAFNKEHWLVLGDFGELGPDADVIHKQLGLDAKASGVTRLFTVGEQSQFASQAFGLGAEHFMTLEQVERQLKNELNHNVVCLLKASHFMRLDKLADALTEAGEK